MPWITPDTSPTSYRCRALFFPEGKEWLAIVEGALQELTFAYNWEKYGSVSIETAVAEYLKMFDAFCFDQGVCRMIGEIVAYGGTVSPNHDWLICDGRELERSAFPDLFNVIGTNFGSAGPTVFNIPDLRGRTLVGAGQGAGLDNYVVGEQFGEEMHTLTVNEMPMHSHLDVGHYHSTGNSSSALAVAPGELPVLIPNPVPTITGTASADIASTGDGEAHENRQPSLAITYLIVAK